MTSEQKQIGIKILALLDSMDQSIETIIANGERIKAATKKINMPELEEEPNN